MPTTAVKRDHNGGEPYDASIVEDISARKDPSTASATNAHCVDKRASRELALLQIWNQMQTEDV